MKFEPNHFHAIAAILMFVGAMYLALRQEWYGAGLLGVGAIVAVLHWKATKSGLVDR